MKKNLNEKKLSCIKLFLLSFFFLIAGVEKTSASHSAGAELTYHDLGGGCYVVTMTFYRDCYGIAAPTSFPVTATSSCGTLNATLLPISGTGQEITVPCPGQQTTCGGGTAPGIQKWVYETQICGIVPCADWVFSASMCCRNAAITTIANAGSYNLCVEATLNNLVVSSNNSPYFTVDPIPFICAGQSFTYNPGVIDLDGDSLVYTSVTPCGVTYVFPFSPLNPFSSVPPASVNPVNGDFTANATTPGEVAVIAVLVQEYRNGILIGSVLRDFQVYIMTCSNQLPTASGINGTTNYSLTACAGSTINFTINSADADAGQAVIMSWNNGIPPATFTTSTGSRPVGTFHWATTLADVRPQPYTFTVTVRDNNCPSTGAQVYSFSIILHTLTVNATSTSVACNGGATGSATATASGTGGPYTYVWSPGGLVGQTRTGMAAGTYTVVATDSLGCSGSATVTVTQSPAIIVTATSGVGTATINVAGGTPPYMYSLNANPSQPTSVITGVAAGTYVETVRDALGCRATCGVVIQ